MKSTGNGKDHGMKLGVAGLLVTLGIVFGDIGTSPLYVMKAIIREDFTIEENFSLEYYHVLSGLSRFKQPLSM